MGKVIIQERYTTKNPITMIGEEAGTCWGADTNDDVKNYKRGLDCLSNEHGRTIEYPDVYMIWMGTLRELSESGIRISEVHRQDFRQARDTSTMSMDLTLSSRRLSKITQGLLMCIPVLWRISLMG